MCQLKLVYSNQLFLPNRTTETLCQYLSGYTHCFECTSSPKNIYRSIRCFSQTLYTKIKHTRHVSYTIYVSQNVTINKGERTRWNKKAVCIFLTYQLDILNFRIDIFYKYVDKLEYKTRSLTFHAFYKFYCIGTEHTLITTNFFLEILNLNKTLLFNLLLFANALSCCYFVILN